VTKKLSEMVTDRAVRLWNLSLSQRPSFRMRQEEQLQDGRA